MATKNIRSEYVKSLLEDKEALNRQLESVTESTIKSIIEDKVKDNFRQIISEDTDTFEEEEVEEKPTDTEDDSKEDEKSEDVTVDDSDVTATDDEENSDETADDELGMGAETADEEGSDDTSVWDELEDYKGEDGEYDLTGMDADSVVKVLKVMKPEDGVRVVKNNDGNYELTDDETGKEYIIQVDVDTDDEDGLAEGKEYCIEFEEHGNTGYTTNYQKQTAMTTPDNHEPADASKTYSMDGGVPTGTEKPFPGKGSKAPYEESVNEEACGEEEAEMNEAMTTQEDGAYNRGAGMIHTNTNAKVAKGRNSHAGGVQVHGTGENSYSEAQMESIKRKANAIFMENKTLKSILPKFKQQLQEAIVINQSLGYVIRLLKENATSLEEKQSIIKKFSDIKTLEEGQSMYKTISEELHRNHQSQNVENVFNSQLSEASKHNVTETPMYQSDDLSKSLDLIRRLNQIK